jgi:phage terminase large subunit-like protein
MSWCAGNARIVPTPTGMRIARDDSGFGKIDPLMSTFNAVALLALNPMPQKKPEFKLAFA